LADGATQHIGMSDPGRFELPTLRLEGTQCKL